jgi:hypothetical protein
MAFDCIQSIQFRSCCCGHTIGCCGSGLECPKSTLLVCLLPLQQLLLVVLACLVLSPLLMLALQALFAPDVLLVCMLNTMHGAAIALAACPVPSVSTKWTVSVCHRAVLFRQWLLLCCMLHVSPSHCRQLHCGTMLVSACGCCLRMSRVDRKTSTGVSVASHLGLNGCLQLCIHVQQMYRTFRQVQQQKPLLLV